MITYRGFKGDFTHDNAVLVSEIKKILETLSKKIAISDLVIFNVSWDYEYNPDDEGKITLLVSGENIYQKRQYNNRYLRFLYHHIENRLGIKLEPFLAPLLPKVFSKKNLKNYVESLAAKRSEAQFAIVTNRVEGQNILNFPYFFHVFLNRFEEFIELKQAQRYVNKQKFCAFIVGDLHLNNPQGFNRIKFFKKLSKYKKVDSYGPVLNNLKVPAHLIEKYKYDHVPLEKALAETHYGQVTNGYLLNQELFRSYKFVICFENSYAEDYITEKLPNVMVANSIGIYRGAPNVNEFFNPKSFINYEDYGSDAKMIEKIIELDRDDEKYQAMLAEPFFVNNELPARVKTAKQDLEKFIIENVLGAIE